MKQIEVYNYNLITTILIIDVFIALRGGIRFIKLNIS